MPAAIAQVVPANTPVNASLATGTTFTATASINPLLPALPLFFTATVSCSSARFTFTTPASGVGPVPISNPVVTGCTDSFGGTDTVSTNSAKGPWTLTFPQTPGGPITMGFPQGGVSFGSSFLPTCTGVMAPNGSASALGTYNSAASTLTFSHVAVPVGGSGCTTGPTATISASIVFSPGLQLTSATTPAPPKPTHKKHHKKHHRKRRRHKK